MRRMLAVIAGAVLLPLAAHAQPSTGTPSALPFDAAFAPASQQTAEPAPGFGTAAGEERWSEERMRTAAPMRLPDVEPEPAGSSTPQ